MVEGQGYAALDRRPISRLTLSPMSVETRQVGDDEAGMRLDRWFHAHFPALPFGHLQKLLRTGQVRVDGARVKTNTRLAPGQRVRVPPLSKNASSPNSGRPEFGTSRRRKSETSAFGWRGGSPRSDGEGLGDSHHAHAGPSSSSPKGEAKKGARQSDGEFLRSIILYEDREVFVLNKPMGLAVQG